MLNTNDTEETCSKCGNSPCTCGSDDKKCTNCNNEPCQCGSADKKSEDGSSCGCR